MQPRGGLYLGMGVLCAFGLGFALPHAFPQAPLSTSLANLVRGLAGEPPSVLVVEVPDRGRAAAVRAAVADERVVAESSHGFALRERRVIVSSLENAGEILGSAGWQDATLQILRFAPAENRRDRARAARTDAERLAELMQQPTLSYVEAQRALTML